MERKEELQKKKKIIITKIVFMTEISLLNDREKEMYPQQKLDPKWEDEL